jgi:hypothetical protein
MRFSHDHHKGNRAVVLLATCLVVLMGAMTCGAIALAANPAKPLPTLIQAGGAVLGIVFLLWVLRERPPENHSKIVWSWLGRRRRRTVAFRAQARLPPSQRAAPPAPPTAESIRAITGRTSTWVPAAGAPTQGPASASTEESA